MGAGARDTSIKLRSKPDDRLAVALERIASALEQANAVRVWPSLEKLGVAGGTVTNGWTCPTCGGWVMNGTFHSCGGGLR